GNDDGTPTKHVTGGGLPVEIWSRFMRSAHQGVPVASLPGSAGGGLFSGLFAGNTPAPANATTGMAPVPPAPVPQTAGNAPAARGASLDGWLLNNFFSRR